MEESNRRLRNGIKDPKLLTKLQHIWDTAEKELHPFQTGVTAQDTQHCLRVEANIWSLIYENQDKFDSKELFLLSASAALHDIGKIRSQEASGEVRLETVRKKEEDHGETAKKLLLKEDNWRKFHFDSKGEAEAVAAIIEVHSNGDMERVPEEFTLDNPPNVFLRSLAAVFRLADMLDSDYRRCPYLARLVKEFKFSDEVEAWIARGSIGGWDKSSDGKTILLKASPDNEEDNIRTLAYVDSLNKMITESHMRVLENCRVQFWENNEHKSTTIRFPVKFSEADLENAIWKEKGGLTKLYMSVAEEYMDKIGIRYLHVDLKGIGDFSEKRDIKLSNIFIDVDVTLESAYAPQSYEGFGEKTAAWIRANALRGDKFERIPVTKAITIPELKRSILLGDPGSGKSIISQFLAVNRQMFENNKASSDTRKPEIVGIPCLVKIREFVFARNREPGLTLLDYISQQVSEILDESIPVGFLKFWLRRENSLVVFDGLDEVIRSEDRKHVRDLVRDFVDKFSEARFLITSRWVGYEEAPLDSNYFLHFSLKDFTLPQKQLFVKKWYAERENDPTERERAIRGLLTALGEEKVDELAKNPLLLTIMALVHRAEYDLPKQRALLYEKCVEAFVVSRDRARDLLSYDDKEIRECHEYLGYAIHVKFEKVEGPRSMEVSTDELTEILLAFINKRYQGTDFWTNERAQEKVNEFLEAARKRVGLIVERGESKWCFGHRSFQEYFAARYINQTTDGIEEIWSEVKNKIENPSWWLETLKLLAGIYGINQKRTLNKFITKIMDEHKKIQDPTLKRLILAAEVAGEVFSAIDGPVLKEIANQTIERSLDTQDSSVFINLKRVLNHFYIDIEMRKYIPQRLRERTEAFRQNPSFFAGTALYRFHASAQFGDTWIDRILAIS